MEERYTVLKIVRKYGTRSPYDLANAMKIMIHRDDLGDIKGYYCKAYRTKHIVLNNSLMKGPEENFVLSHELGHAVLHPDVNTPFLRTKTYLSVDKLEVQANKFAMELLIPDVMIREYIMGHKYTTDMLARLLGYQRELIELRLKLNED